MNSNQGSNSVLVKLRSMCQRRGGFSSSLVSSTACFPESLPLSTERDNKKSEAQLPHTQSVVQRLYYHDAVRRMGIEKRITQEKEKQFGSWQQLQLKHEKFHFITRKIGSLSMVYTLRCSGSNASDLSKHSQCPRYASLLTRPQDQLPPDDLFGPPAPKRNSECLEGSPVGQSAKRVHKATQTRSIRLLIGNLTANQLASQPSSTTTPTNALSTGTSSIQEKPVVFIPKHCQISSLEGSEIERAPQRTKRLAETLNLYSRASLQPNSRTSHLHAERTDIHRKGPNTSHIFIGPDYEKENRKLSNKKIANSTLTETQHAHEITQGLGIGLNCLASTIHIQPSTGQMPQTRPLAQLMIANRLADSQLTRVDNLKQLSNIGDVANTTKQPYAKVADNKDENVDCWSDANDYPTGRGSLLSPCKTAKLSPCLR